MIWLAAGGATLLVILGSLYALASASVEGAKRALAWGAGAVALVVAAGLLVSGRGGLILYGLLALGPWAWRRWQARRTAAAFGAATGEDAVETAWLSMRLDPGSGALSGTVRRGAHAGRDLADVPPDALRALRDELAREDAESVPLLEAWMDRAHPGWRDAAGGDAAAPMTRAEALAILGLGDDAPEGAIRAAHARLMRAAHPDAGGSHWLAARVNAARDLLLGAGR